jgi:hypothetical protein
VTGATQKGIEMKQVTVGSQVTFRFTGWDQKVRTGFGIVAHDEIVGTDNAWTIRVTSSPDYRTGEYIDVRARNVWLTQ